MKAVIGSAGLRIAGMGFGFLVGVQLARGLGAEGYGVYGLAMSIIALLTVPTEFGIPQLLTREVAVAQVNGDWPRLRGIFQWASRSVVLIAVFVAALVLGWLLISEQAVGSSLGTRLLIGLVLVPLVALGNVISAALRGLQHIVKGQVPDSLLRPALHSLLLFIAPSLFFSLTPAVAVGLGAAAAGASLAVGALMLRREMPCGVSASPITMDARAWWVSAVPMALTEGMRVLQAHLVILFLGLMSTVAVVGVYRVATSVALLMTFPISLFNIVSAPAISRLYTQGDHQRLRRMLGWMSACMTLSALIFLLPFVFAGNFILGEVFGAEFAEGSTPVLVLGAGLVVNGFFGVSATLLNMTGHQRHVTRASVISLVLLAVLLPPLISFGGMSGAASASSLALGVWNLIMWRDARRLLSIDTCALAIFARKSS